MIGSGCAPRSGWERTDARVCEAKAPAVVCLHAWPDRAVEATIGEVGIVPGECVQAPKGGGRLRVRWRDAAGAEHDKGVRAPKGVRTEIALARDGKMHVARRVACDRGMTVFEP